MYKSVGKYHRYLVQGPYLSLSQHIPRDLHCELECQKIKTNVNVLHLLSLPSSCLSCMFSQHFFLTLSHAHIFTHPALFPLTLPLPASLPLTSYHSPPAAVLGLHGQLGTAHHGKRLHCCGSGRKLLHVALSLPKGSAETCCLYTTIVPALLLGQGGMHPSGQVPRGRDVPRAVLCIAVLRYSPQPCREAAL